MRQAHYLFPADPHALDFPAFRNILELIRVTFSLAGCKYSPPPLLAQNELSVARQLRLHLFEHLLVGNTRAAHLVLMLG
jgi:hypothetical protein